MNSFKGSNSNVYKSNSNSNKKSSNKPQENITSGQRFFLLEEPHVMSKTIKTYTAGQVRIKFLNNQLYNKYYRKARINGNVGYVNMNSFK